MVLITDSSIQNGGALGPQPSLTSEKKTRTKLMDLISLHLEPSMDLSKKYRLDVKEVEKVSEAVSAVCELYTIFGLVGPQSRAWFLKHRQTPNPRKREEVFQAKMCNHVKNKTIHNILKFVSVNGEGSWVKLLKWKFASFFAYVRDQDIPAKPDFVYPLGKNQHKIAFFSHKILLSGIYEDYLVQLSRMDYDRFMQFVDTTQQLKKGMPDVPESMIAQAKVKTRQELTGTPKPSIEQSFYFESKYWVDINRPRVELELRRTVTELFENQRIESSDLYEPFFPSTSANYIWSRSKCGALSELYARLDLGKFDSGIEFGVETLELFQRVPVAFGSLGKSEQVRLTQEVQLLGHEQTERCPVLVADDTYLREVWKDSYLKIWNLARSERPLVQTVGLAEPLKVRVISKGPPLLYTVLKPLQKWMWGILKKNQVFSLIGRYVVPDDINRILGGMKEDEIALSGDYVASTDNLHSWVTETILDQMMIELGQNIGDLSSFPEGFMGDLKVLMKRALTQHIFVEEDVEYAQTEGQLMGSIISFPFLCIANAALCRVALEEATLGKKKFRLTDRPYPNSGAIAPLMVNGDDNLMKGHHQRLRVLWEAFCGFAGLNSSIGKTYFSNSFCTINSTIFERNSDNLWVERKYVNLGLMMGRRRIGAGLCKDFNPQVGIHQLGVICRELKRSCPVELWPKVKKRFIYYNKRSLDQYPGLPWFLPEWLGGVGLPVDHPDEISEIDRKCATVIKMFYNNPKYRNLHPCKPKDAAMWLMHKRVMKDLKPYEWLGKPNYRKAVGPEGVYSLEDEYARLYKLMTINLLLKEPLENLYEILDEDKNVAKSLWHNCNVFRDARPLIWELQQTVEPMSDEDMIYENKDLVIPCLITPFQDGYNLAGLDRRFLRYPGLDIWGRLNPFPQEDDS